MKSAGAKLDERLVERVSFRGHPMVRALHPRTIEVTREDHLTERGDCIIGVGADKGCSDLDSRVRTALRDGSARVRFRIVVGAREFEFEGSGDAGLTLEDPREMVIRTTGFVSGRTLAVRAGASAADIPREMVTSLQRPDAVGRLELEVL